MGDPSCGNHEWGPQMEATNGATKVDHEWGPPMEATNENPQNQSPPPLGPRMKYHYLP
jgi:hypothetical protein